MMKSAPRYSIRPAVPPAPIKPRIVTHDNFGRISEEADGSCRSEWKRSQVISELLSSEKTYIEHLDALLTTFADPLSRQHHLIQPMVHRTLFSELRSIRLVNQVLYDHLCRSDVAEAFATLMPYLKLYASYARNFPASQHKLEELMNKSKSFVDFVRSAEASPDAGGLKLPALLIMPIQRIPRYRLLLKQLIQYSSDVEAEQLTAIVQQLNSVAEHVNECVRDYENTMQIMAVQAKLDKYAPRLLVPGRRLIKYGLLKKLSRRQPGQHQFRHFWLFTDVILYAKSPAKNRVLRNRDQLQCCCVMPLRHCLVERTYGTNTFTITCRNECVTLCTDTYVEVSDWLDALGEAIKVATADRQTLRKESSKRPVLHRSMLRRIRKQASTLTRRHAHKIHQEREGAANGLLANKPNVLASFGRGGRQMGVATRNAARHLLNRALNRHRSGQASARLVSVKNVRQSSRKSTRSRGPAVVQRQRTKIRTRPPSITTASSIVSQDYQCESVLNNNNNNNNNNDDSFDYNNTNNNYMALTLTDHNMEYDEEDEFSCKRRRRSYGTAMDTGELRISQYHGTDALENLVMPSCRLSTVTEEATFIASEHNATLMSSCRDSGFLSNRTESPRCTSVRSRNSQQSKPWWSQYDEQQEHNLKRSLKPPTTPTAGPRIRLFEKIGFGSAVDSAKKRCTLL